MLNLLSVPDQSAAGEMAHLHHMRGGRVSDRKHAARECHPRIQAARGWLAGFSGPLVSSEAAGVRVLRR